MRRRLATLAILACVTLLGGDLGGAQAARRRARPPAPAGVPIFEKDVNLDESLRLAQALRQAGMEVVLTRDRDVFVPLEARSETAHSSGADVFLSVHNNASTDRGVRGTEIYHQRGDAGGAALARSILTGIAAAARLGSRGTFTRAGDKGDDYYAVLRNTRPTALIIEGAYLSNPQEARALNDAAVRQRLALGITAGVVERLRALPPRGPGPGPSRLGPSGAGIGAPGGLTAQRVGGPGGRVDGVLGWQPVAGATAYTVWRDGFLVGRTAAASAAIGPTRPEVLAFRDVAPGFGIHRYDVRAVTELAGQSLLESESAVTELLVPWKVVVDPGHGGKDPGAIGRL